MLVGLCVLAMTYAVDWGRVIFFAAPVFYVAGAYALRHRPRLAVLAIVAFLALDLGYAGYMQFHGVKHSLDSAGRLARGRSTDPGGRPRRRPGRTNPPGDRLQAWGPSRRRLVGRPLSPVSSGCVLLKDKPVVVQ